MRGLPVRRIASTALCVTLAIGIAAPAAAAADTDTARERAHAASLAPVPGADALLSQTKSLGDLASVLTAVTDLLNAVLKADDGQLTSEQATQLGDAVKAAIAKITAAAPATPATPATPPAAALPETPASPETPALPATPALPETPVLPATPALPLPAVKGGQDDGKPGTDRAAPADLKDDALAAVQKAVADLLAAATSGDVGKVVPALTGVVTGLVNLLAATLLGSGLPAANLPGLPQLPSLPALPVEAPALPVEAPALPATGLLPSS